MKLILLSYYYMSLHRKSDKRNTISSEKEILEKYTKRWDFGKPTLSFAGYVGMYIVALGFILKWIWKEWLGGKDERNQ